MNPNLSAKLSLKALSYFNYICLYLSNIDALNLKEVNLHNQTHLVPLKEVFKHIGKIFNFCCVIYKNYQTKHNVILNQTLDTICSYSNLISATFDTITNKTAIFIQDIIYQNTVFSTQRNYEKSPLKTLKKVKYSQSEEEEQRLGEFKVLPKKLRRSSSDDQLSLQRSINAELSKDVEVSFKDYNSSNQKSTVKTGSNNVPLVNVTKIIIQEPVHNAPDITGNVERNRDFYLLHPDEWAEQIIKGWELIRDPVMQGGITEADSEQYENLIKDLNEFLSSYLPCMRNENIYNKI